MSPATVDPVAAGIPGQGGKHAADPASGPPPASTGGGPEHRGATVVSAKALRHLVRAAASERPEVTKTGTAHAEITGGSADIALEVTLVYPCRVPDAVNAVRDHLQRRVSMMAGLTGRRIALRVTGFSAREDGLR
jgi:uncharacterized alkaline shock family protein YloU